MGAFLASSWTWCIGMFLPVLLLRDLGAWSFLVFAIPNCAGAALMGYVLRRQGASEELVRHHRMACVWFSRITVGFHAFFLMWMVQLHGVALPVIAGFVVNVVVNLLATGRGWPGWATAALTYTASVICAAVMAWSGSLAVQVAHAPVLPESDLLWLAPVCVFGFTFCPYLDLSFHTARRVLPEPGGTRAFVAGFGGLFLLMIVLTLAYAGMFLRSDASMGLGTIGTGGVMKSAFGLAAVTALFVHISTQAAFTMHLHLGMISQTLHGERWKVDATTMMSLLIPMAIGIAAPWFPDVGGIFGGAGAMSGGEAVYRTFMAFYGLVFPGYVWICVLPSWNRSSSRLQRLTLAATVGIAIPMFYMGFIERQTWWLAPGLAVVLAGRWVSRRKTARAVVGG